ncbi:MAG: hypothetical protein U0527_00660 [Candidatus Eisenbacteria bacterium]
MSDSLAAIQPLNPERVAHRSIYGYLYQTALAVKAWIALEDDELLLVEGDEDFDRILLGEAGVERVATQVKSSSVDITTAAFRETITNFFLAFTHPDRREQRQKFVLVTAATVHWGTRGPLPALAGWESAPTGEAADKLAGGVRDLLVGATPSRAGEREALAAGIRWANEERARWSRFVESVQLRLAQPDLDQTLEDAERLLRASGRTSLPPIQIVQAMLAHLLRASANAEPVLRTRSRADLSTLLERMGLEIAQWLSSDAARFLTASIDELPRLEKLLRDGTGVLPARELTPDKSSPQRTRLSPSMIAGVKRSAPCCGNGARRLMIGRRPTARRAYG